MADTNKKFFLDLTGLQTLWTKMKGTFADKKTTDDAISTINGRLSTIDGNIVSLGEDVEANLASLAVISPKAVENYSAALEASKTLAVGTVVKVENDETVGEIKYNGGFYFVDGMGSIKYIGTSSGADEDGDLELLNQRVSSLEEKKIDNASIVAGENSKTIIEKGNLIINYDDAVVDGSDSMNALTHKAIAAKFGEFASLLSSVPKFKIEVVSTLPTENMSFSTIYLVTNENGQTENLYTEYIYIQDSVKGNHWEKLGEQTISLGGYVTEEGLQTILNTKLKDYYTTKQVDDAIANAVNAAKTEINNSVAQTYATKETVNAIDQRLAAVEAEDYVTSGEVEGTYLKKADAESTYIKKGDIEIKDWMTKDEIISSIQSDEEGSIGKEIMITVEQIESLS